MYSIYQMHRNSFRKAETAVPQRGMAVFYVHENQDMIQY